MKTVSSDEANLQLKRIHISVFAKLCSPMFFIVHALMLTSRKAGVGGGGNTLVSYSGNLF